jgi:hypothetical protein
VWHAPSDQLDMIRTSLATMASHRHDAHLVKYTLACLHVAESDPTFERLYLAAAAKLLADWVIEPDPLD